MTNERQIALNALDKIKKTGSVSIKDVPSTRVWNCLKRCEYLHPFAIDQRDDEELLLLQDNSLGVYAYINIHFPN